MAVIKRPPLIVPPDFNLRPPRPGDQDAAGRAASDAARRTLIGPSSTGENGANKALNGSSSLVDGKAPPAEPSSTRAILTGGTPENGSASTDGATSDGQSLLISRTDSTQRDLDELTETRAENRIDSALLRRLLAWSPDDRPAPAEGEEGDAKEKAVVQVVSRSQTLIGAQPDAAEQKDAE